MGSWRIHCPIAPLPHCLILLVLVSSACTSGPPPPDNRPYEQQVAAWRQSKDAAFRSTSRDSFSPIPEAQRAAFPGLAYFPVGQTYRVPAYLTLQPTQPPQFIELQTSGPEQRRRVQKVGSLAFTLAGEPYKLIAFADEGSLTRLFVPFYDLTNGRETYRGGRYLEIERTATGIYDLDFNHATNPYCVYSTSYDCPIPPRENRLTVAIRAGEMLPASYNH
jgi:uncharacterized protein (DUF1684 family)